VVSDAKVAVYDLGGGTFDISLLHLHEGVYESRRRAATAFWCEDIDARIVGLLAEGFQAETGIDLRGERMACNAA